jgi:hypothetical protein
MKRFFIAAALDVTTAVPDLGDCFRNEFERRLVFDGVLIVFGWLQDVPGLFRRRAVKDICADIPQSN